MAVEPLTLSMDGLRLALAVGGLALAVSIERARPFRGASPGGLRRELHNLALWGLNGVLLWTVPFAASVAAARLAAEWNLGLLNVWHLPLIWVLPLAVAAADAWTWGLHRLYHAVPALWRIHRVHHVDEHLSVTTGVRFHPAEVLLSALGRLPLIFGLGLPVEAVVCFEIVLLAASQLQHADVRLPAAWDRMLTAGFVTPNLHRVHHSTRRHEADSNFGTILSLWDRVSGTFRPVPPERVEVGAPDGSSGEAAASFLGILGLPFRRGPGARTTWRHPAPASSSPQGGVRVSAEGGRLE